MTTNSVTVTSATFKLCPEMFKRNEDLESKKFHFMKKVSNLCYGHQTLLQEFHLNSKMIMRKMNQRISFCQTFEKFIQVKKDILVEKFRVEIRSTLDKYKVEKGNLPLFKRYVWRKKTWQKVFCCIKNGFSLNLFIHQLFFHDLQQPKDIFVMISFLNFSRNWSWNIFFLIKISFSSFFGNFVSFGGIFILKQSRYANFSNTTYRVTFNHVLLKDVLYIVIF